MYFIFTKKEICKNLPNISLFDTRPLNLIWIWTWNKIKYTSLSSIDNSKYKIRNRKYFKLETETLKELSRKSKTQRQMTQQSSILNRMFGFNEPAECTVWALDYLHFSVSRICWVTFVNYNTSLCLLWPPATAWCGPAQPNWPMRGRTAGSNWPMTASLREPLDQSSPHRGKQKQAVTWRCWDNSQSICMTYLQHFIYKSWGHSVE